ncbi:LysR family transcriptional regulator [Alcaligenaceae bacterium]|nr:LysR family transcriptional regulator [Alcaligenaceae bacterium]
MEIRQFEAFAAVHTTGSVTAAARLLDRSQPVVSRQLQDLEQQLGFTLFARTRPQVTLTDQGRQFLEEVRNVLTGLQQLEARSREIAEGLTRPVRIASSLSLGGSLLPEVLAEMDRSGSGFEYKLQVDVMPSSRIVQALLDGDADLGIASLPLELGRCQLHWSAQAPCQVALRASHPLAGAATVSAAQLMNETVITLSNASRMRHRMSTALLHPSRPRSQRQIVTTSTMSAVMMVKAGLGVALVDPCVALCFQQEGVVYRPLDAYVPYMFGAITHGERPPGAEAGRIIEAVHDYAFAHIPQLTPGDITGIPILSDPQALAVFDDGRDDLTGDHEPTDWATP